jgi:hypothetical protein
LPIGCAKKILSSDLSPIATHFESRDNGDSCHRLDRLQVSVQRPLTPDGIHSVALNAHCAIGISIVGSHVVCVSKSIVDTCARIRAKPELLDGQLAAKLASATASLRTSSL